MDNIKKYTIKGLKYLALAGISVGVAYLMVDKDKRAEKNVVFKAMPIIYSMDSTYHARRDSIDKVFDAAKKNYHLQKDSLWNDYETKKDSLRKVYDSYLEQRVR